MKPNTSPDLRRKRRTGALFSYLFLRRLQLLNLVGLWFLHLHLLTVVMVMVVMMMLAAFLSFLLPFPPPFMLFPVDFTGLEFVKEIPT